MREIKFRAVIKATNEVFPVITIWSNSVCLDLSGSKYEYPEKVFLMDEVELMQYTGLHDDSGDEVEIFENDIVEFEYEGSTYRGLIKFEGGCVIIACNELPDSYITMFDIAEFDRDYLWINGKVIGNKFNNPELMKESD